MTLTRTIATKRGETPRTEIVPDEAALRAEWAAADEVRARRTKKEALRDEALARITAVEPAWSTFEIVALVASLWSRLDAPSASHQRARDIYVYARNVAIPKADSVDDIGSVDPGAAKPFAVADPADPGWPA